MKLNKENAIRVIKKQRPKAGPRYTYIFKCQNDACNKEISVRSDNLKKHSGLCQSHSHQKPPFEGIFNNILKDNRGLEVSLTYKQFLEFTKIKNCHYCNNKIIWNPYSTVDGKFISMAYNLDRKFNNQGYTKENCVVCCSRCNNFKSNYDYGEFVSLCGTIYKNVLDNISKTYIGKLK